MTMAEKWDKRTGGMGVPRMRGLQSPVSTSESSGGVEALPATGPNRSVGRQVEASLGGPGGPLLALGEGELQGAARTVPEAGSEPPPPNPTFKA